MCNSCGCQAAGNDGNFGTVNPYGIKAPEVNKPTTLGEK